MLSNLLPVCASSRSSRKKKRGSNNNGVDISMSSLSFRFIFLLPYFYPNKQVFQSINQDRGRGSPGSLWPGIKARWY